jgi:hypothetical protein
VEAAGGISYEFAYHQLGDPGNAGMYNYFFPRNVSSQPLILRAFGGSPQELPLEYQVGVLFMNISVKNGVNRGHDLGISIAESRAKSDNFTAKAPVPKPL